MRIASLSSPLRWHDTRHLCHRPHAGMTLTIVVMLSEAGRTERSSLRSRSIPAIIPLRKARDFDFASASGFCPEINFATAQPEKKTYNDPPNPSPEEPTLFCRSPERSRAEPKGRKSGARPLKGTGRRYTEKLVITLPAVMLSGAVRARSEPTAQSKHPYNPPRCVRQGF
jgi:hypothetical protein